MQEALNKYVSLFCSLHTNKQKGMPAPHKAVLLLSVIDMIEAGVIKSNEIELSERLEQCFKHNWDRYIGRSVIFAPKIGTPFFHLHSESFWTFIIGKTKSAHFAKRKVQKLFEISAKEEARCWRL